MKDTKRIRVIIKNPHEPYGHEAMLLDRLATYQNVVDGPIETVPLTDKAVIVCDEEGKLNNKKFNFFKGQGQEDYLCGTVIVVGVAGDEFTDCPISMETWKTFLRLWGTDMLKAGDFVQCKKSEMVQYSLDLNEMGVYNDFVFEPVPGIQIMGPWLDPEVEVPAEDGVFHFALVNGKAKDGATCEEAPAVVEYWHDEGWFCDSMEVFDVVCWIPVPGFAKEEK